MSNVKKGNEYHDFVETVYMAILAAEHREGKITPITIQRGKEIKSAGGTPYKSDIYWEYMLAGIQNCVTIECKNYNKKVDLPEVRNFARAIENISGLKGLMVTKIGFTENAIIEASSDNIDLLVIRETSDEDWGGYLRQIDIKMMFKIPSRVASIVPIFNKEWALQNGYQNGDTFELCALNNEIFIEDVTEGFKQSIHELESKDFFENKGPGLHSWTRDFINGWLVTPQGHYKIDSITIDYDKPKVYESNMTINFESYVLAVMEFINGQCDKYLVLKTGERKPYNA